jgi:hypothetical protein
MRRCGTDLQQAKLGGCACSRDSRAQEEVGSSGGGLLVLVGSEERLSGQLLAALCTEVLLLNGVDLFILCCSNSRDVEVVAEPFGPHVC